MLFPMLRALVFGLVALMLLPTIGLAAIGTPSLDAHPSVLAGWAVLFTCAAATGWVFVTDALRTRRRALSGLQVE